MTGASDQEPEPQLKGIALIAMVVAVMSAMMLEIIDMTVVNVALPHIMGSFGATSDQVTWVASSYMVAAAVVMPLTGYLSRKFGRRRLLLSSISGFMLASMACGAAQSIEQLVLFRILQGLSGATLAPLAQSMMMSNFTKEQRGKGMALWGMGLMVAPIMGPTLGGYIVESLNWRWVFYINIPVALFSLMLASAYVPGDRGANVHTDWKGMGLLVAAISCLQLVLDLGHSYDWLESPVIQALAVLSFLCFAAFIEHAWDNPRAIVNLSVYRDRNFSMGSVLVVIFSMSMMSIMAILPIMLSTVMGYPADVIGEIMAPRVLPMILAMAVMGRFVNKTDPRIVMFAGSLLLSAGTFMYALLPPAVTPFWVILPGLVQGLGMGLFIVPSTTLAYETLPRHLMDGAAGLYTLVRAVGGALGVAAASTVLSHRGTYHWQVLREHITPYSDDMHNWLGARGLMWNDPAAGPSIVGEVARQAQVLAFGDVYIAMAFIVAVLSPLVLLMRHPKHAAPIPKEVMAH